METRALSNGKNFLQPTFGYFLPFCPLPLYFYSLCFSAQKNSLSHFPDSEIEVVALSYEVWKA